MATRREASAPRARRVKNGGKSSWTLPVEVPKVPEGDFLPPGFSTDVKPEAVNGEVTTYFLHTEKRGLSRYLPMVLKHEQKGFRAVIVTKAKLVFDQRNAQVAGRLSGDHFEAARQWVKRNILDELQGRYVLNGGGTQRERERTVRRFFRAMKARDALEEKRRQADAELEQASIEMVLRFGKKPFVLPEANVTLDACYGPGDKVYWRSRSGKPPELPE